jgi:hypothetical protein
MTELKRGDIVQVDPSHEWGGCLVVITEPKGWGVQGFVQIPKGGRAYIRLNNDVIECVGHAVWLPKGEADKGAAEEVRARQGRP